MINAPEIVAVTPNSSRRLRRSLKSSIPKRTVKTISKRVKNETKAGSTSRTAVEKIKTITAVSTPMAKTKCQHCLNIRNVLNPLLLKAYVEAPMKADSDQKSENVSRFIVPKACLVAIGAIAVTIADRTAYTSPRISGF